jgi:hypothetical protein
MESKTSVAFFAIAVSLLIHCVNVGSSNSIQTTLLSPISKQAELGPLPFCVLNLKPSFVKNAFDLLMSLTGREIQNVFISFMFINKII